MFLLTSRILLVSGRENGFDAARRNALPDSTCRLCFCKRWLSVLWKRTTDRHVEQKAKR